MANAPKTKGDGDDKGKAAKAEPKAKAEAKAKTESKARSEGKAKARSGGAAKGGTSSGKHAPAQFYSLVRRPIVTEKSTTMQALRNQFTFEVARGANKIEVRKAIETLFSVKVVKVNIVGVPSKKKRAFGRPGETKPWKKAVVTLREGDSIDIS